MPAPFAVFRPFATVGNPVRLIMLLAVIACAPSLAWGASLQWGNIAGGTFSTPGNWKSGIAPTAADAVYFQTPKHAYSVNFSADAATDGLYVNGDQVTLNLQGHTYKVTTAYRDAIEVYNYNIDNYVTKLRVTGGVIDTAGVNVGGSANTLSVMEVVGPATKITQYDQYGEVTVGDEGAGELLIDDRAEVYANSFGVWIGGNPGTGDNAHGLVTISNGGKLISAGTNYLGQHGGSADLKILSGGSFQSTYSFVGGHHGGVNNVLAAC